MLITSKTKTRLRIIFVIFVMAFSGIRWFLGSRLGIGILSYLLYLLSPYLFGVTPLSFDELTIAVLSLEESQLLWVFGFLLTITGYSIAGSQAARTKQRDMIYEERKLAAKEIELFFAKVITSLNLISIHVERMRALERKTLGSNDVEKIQNDMLFE